MRERRIEAGSIAHCELTMSQVEGSARAIERAVRASGGRQGCHLCMPGDVARHIGQAERGDYSEADLCFSWRLAYRPCCKPLLGFYTLYQGRKARTQERAAIKAEREAAIQAERDAILRGV